MLIIIKTKFKNKLNDGRSKNQCVTKRHLLPTKLDGQLEISLAGHSVHSLEFISLPRLQGQQLKQGYFPDGF